MKPRITVHSRSRLQTLVSSSNTTTHTTVISICLPYIFPGKFMLLPACFCCLCSTTLSVIFNRLKMIQPYFNLTYRKECSLGCGLVDKKSLSIREGGMDIHGSSDLTASSGVKKCPAQNPGQQSQSKPPRTLQIGHW